MPHQHRPTDDRKSAVKARPGFVRIGLYRRLRLLVALPLFSSAIVAGVVYAMPNRYIATAVLQIDPRQKSANDTGETASAEPLRTIEDEIGTLQSDAVLAEVVDRLSLSADPELNAPGPRSLFDKIIHWRFEPKASVVASVRARLTVARVRNTQLVALHYGSADPAKAALVANTITDEYLREQRDGRWHATVADNSPAHTMNDAPTSETASDRVFQAMVSQNGLSLQLPGARVITAAEHPAESSGPKRTETIVIAAAASFAVSIGAALALALFSRTDNARLVERSLACRHLASLPCVDESRTHRAACAMRRVIGDPQSAYAEAIRQACTGLQSSQTPGVARVILVTSANAGDGAESVASNVAHGLAADGEMVLLVDADFRGKALTRQLAGHCTRGLLDQIACRARLDDAILHDSVTGLCFLPAAGPAPIPLSIFNVLKSATFTGGIGALKDQFSTIIVSAPPVLSSDETSALADVSDQIVFVAPSGRTPSRTLAEAAASLGANQSKVAGAVLTDVDSRYAHSVMSFGDLGREIRRLAVTGFSARAA